MKLVTVSFPGSTRESDITAFGDWLVTSSWLSMVGAEYGVGSGTHQHVALTDSLPASIAVANVDALIQQHVADHSLPSGQDVLYAVFLPDGAQIKETDPSYSCAVYHGRFTPAFHRQTETPGTSSYALVVVPTCTALTRDVLEVAASHEIIEAATNPYIFDNPAYIFPTGDPWEPLGGEIADMCEANWPIDGHTVTRVWSNQAAANSHNPCAPSNMPFYEVSVSPPSATIPPGGTASFTITGWSSAQIDPWMVIVEPSYFDSSADSLITSTIDVAKLGNGDVGHVTLTAPARISSGTTATIYIESAADQTTSFSWPITLQIQ
jgi:hypothetical protein